MQFRTVFKCITILFSVLAIICFVIYLKVPTVFWLVIMIVMFTTSYHLIIRIVVGTLIDVVTYKGINVESAWFKERKFEKKLYKIIKVKKWKHIIPAWQPEIFSLSHYDLKKILENMCAAEIIHEIIIILGYASAAFSLLTPDWKVYIWIFFITAFAAGLCDVPFVILQRYNRPRILRIMKIYK